MHAQLNELTPELGAEIRGVDVRNVTQETAVVLASWLLRYVVLIIREQTLTSSDHVAFSQHFGMLEEFPQRPSHREGSDSSTEPWTRYIFPVASRSSHGYKGVGLYWHTDGYFYAEPTAVSMLRAVQLPARGGDTWFANMYRAYETLPDDLKHRVEGLTAVARPAPDTQRGVGLFGQSTASEVRYPEVRHPLVRPHPITGRKVLYLNVRNIAEIEGLSRRERDSLLERLINHIDEGSFTYCHSWRSGDLVIWDNGAAAHKATLPDPESLRVMERTTVVGSEYFRSDFWKAAGRLAKTAEPMG